LIGLWLSRHQKIITYTCNNGKLKICRGVNSPPMVVRLLNRQKQNSIEKLIRGPWAKQLFSVFKELFIALEVLIFGVD